MKKIVTVIFLFIFILPVFAFDEGTDLMNLDFNAIDNPFQGQKIISDKEYNEALKKHETKEKRKGEGFWAWVFRHTLPKEMQVERKTEPEFDKDNALYLPEEFKTYNEILKRKPSLTLGTTIYDFNGKEIAPGHYQLMLKNDEIAFVQGFETFGYIKAFSAEDNYDTNEIIYARIVDINQDYIKIIFSNSKACYEGFAKVKH